MLAIAANTFTVPDVSAKVPANPLFPLHSVPTLERHQLLQPHRADTVVVARAAAPLARFASPEAAPIDAPAPSVVAASTRPVDPARTISGFWAQLKSGRTVTGAASWYPGTRGYGGTAHVAMPGGNYLPRGTHAPAVRICVDGRCLVVPVVDSCQCYWATSGEMLVDLSLPLVHQLGLDPTLGIYPVEITLVGG